MLYITDDIIRLGGVMLPGLVQSVNIQESANIYTPQDDTGAVNSAVQPRGYDISKITVEVILEATVSQTVEQMIRSYKSLFKKPGQSSAKKMAIVNADCAAHGITSAYFKAFETKNVISESSVTATLELWSPSAFVAVKVVKKSKKKTSKKKSSKKKTKKKKSKSAAKDKRKTGKAKKKARKITKK